MLAKRIIPTLLMNGDKLVKGRRFNSWRSVGHIMQAAEIYAQRGADEIVLLDIAATPEGRGPNLKQIEKVAAKFFTPLTVGGGVRTIEDVRDLLNAGADKVAICTAAVDSDVVADSAARFGSQAIVVAIDHSGFHNCMATRGGKEFHHVCDPPLGADYGRGLVGSWATIVAEMGAGEILLTSIDREGTMEGYDLDCIRQVSSAVDIPVIAHGGCSGYADMAAAIAAGASAVAAGALFQFTDCTPRGAAKFLHEHGIEARV